MSLRSPRQNGFQPLPANNRSMSYETDIPLTSIQTRSSSTGRGARKPGDGALNDLSSHPTFPDSEKKGFFDHGPAGRRKIKKINSKPRRIGTDGEEVSVTGLGRFYNKVVNFSVVTRYLVYVLPVALLIAAPIVIFAVLNSHAIFGATGIKVYIFWTWIEIVWLSIWVSKLVAKVIPYVFMFLCGVVSSGTRKYAMILRAVEIPLSLVGWAVTCLVTFTALMDPTLNGVSPQRRWVTVVKNLLGPALIASLLYLGEKMFIQLISINYHRRSFDGRIKDSKHSIHLLGLLYEASRTLFPMYCDEFIEEDYVINDSIEAMLGKTKGHRRSGSATPLKLIGDIGRIGDKVTSVFGNIASEITGKQVFNPTSAHSIVVEALEKTRSSEALAKRLWMSFVVEGKEALYEEDIKEVLGPARKEEAQETFSALDNDGNGDISLEEMIMKVVEMGRDRKAIAASMRDVGQAIGVLDSVLITIIFIIVIFVFVAFQDTNFVTTLVTAGTTLLSLSFVFAVTTQEFLGSCIFLFIKHPYDVGDRVDIVGPTQEYLVVEQISLLFTVFKRIDTMKMVQVPNIILNTLWIENITRSKAMKEQLDMFISFDTSLEDIELLRKEMESFVRNPENARDFQPDIILEATGIGNMDKLQLKVEIRHKSNWHNESVRAARRSKFMCALVLALRKIPIYSPGGGNEALGGPTNPGYSVAVSDSDAKEARDKAKEAKEAKRLVSSANAKSTGVDLGSKREQTAAESMNKRKPKEAAVDAVWRAEDGSETDKDTLNSRDASVERKKREDDIDTLKQGLLKRESTRGRRKPGESLPPVPQLGQPGMSLTTPSPPPPMGFMASTGQVLDEEAELGYNAYQQFSAPNPSNPSNTSNAYGGQGYGIQTQPLPQPQQGFAGQGMQQQSMGYSMFPPASRTQQGQGQGQGSQAQALNSNSTAGGGGQSAGRLRRLSLGFRTPGNGNGGVGGESQ